MILGALEDAGGQKYLKRQAEENPGPFMTLVAKVLPREVQADVTMKGTVNLLVTRMFVAAKRDANG